MLAVKHTHPDTETEMNSAFVIVPGNMWTDKKSEGTNEKRAKLRKESDREVVK